METLRLFNQALKVYSVTDLAQQLYLHTGTVNRWRQQKRVPDSYEADFLRILNLKKDIQGERKKDQFYTKPEVAEKCFQEFKKVMEKLDINLNRYHFIEPSAGCGCFYHILPGKRKTGIDIDPKTENILLKVII